MNYKELITKYYQSYEDKDRKTLETILAQDCKFISSWANYENVKDMLDTIWPQVMRNKNKVTDLEIFKLDNEHIVKYNLRTPDIIPVVEYIQFEEYKISKIKVFTKA